MARYRVPTLYQYRYFVTTGGLISYVNDVLDQYIRAADYIDRILKGAKLSDLPVQSPTKYELVINLKTAEALVGRILTLMLRDTPVKNRFHTTKTHLRH